MLAGLLIALLLFALIGGALILAVYLETKHLSPK